MKRGFKAMINGQGCGFKFEVGQTYSFDGEVILGEQGFHYCPIMQYVFKFYPPQPGLEIFEIADLGKQHASDGHRAVTDKIKIKSKVPREKFVGFDFLQENNKIFFKDPKGFSCEKEYDENNRLIFFKDFTGYFERKTYDLMGRQLSFENSNGCYWKKTYDSDGNLLTFEDFTGHCTQRNYDSNNNQWQFNYRVLPDLKKDRKTLYQMRKVC